jgi:hypothetical protein
MTLCALAAAPVPLAHGQESAELGLNREYLIKAAFLYNFGRYVEWPPESFASGAPFIIGVLGPDPFGTAIDQLGATKNIEGRPIAIRRFTSMDEYRPCQVLFIAAGASRADKTAAIRQTEGTPILLVSEEPGMAANGAVINFYTEYNKVRFEINQEAAQHRQLRISSKLLSLGKLVGQ